ncbi:hypothetical protein BPSP16_08940 [Brachyspira pilosicoli SP16]|nr:hypothetical protein BPSP16_08940 [Brachyspira pilosicoli SP16]
MQPFCFFAAAKEVGGRGLVPENNKKFIDFIVLFPAAKVTKSASVLALYFGIYKIISIFCYT